MEDEGGGGGGTLADRDSRQKSMVHRNIQIVRWWRLWDSLSCLPLGTALPFFLTFPDGLMLRGRSTGLLRERNVVTEIPALLAEQIVRACRGHSNDRCLFEAGRETAE